VHQLITSGRPMRVEPDDFLFRLRHQVISRCLHMEKSHITLLSVLHSQGIRAKMTKSQTILSYCGVCRSGMTCNSNGRQQNPHLGNTRIRTPPLQRVWQNTAHCCYRPCHLCCNCCCCCHGRSCHASRQRNKYRHPHMVRMPVETLVCCTCLLMKNKAWLVQGNEN